MKYKINGFLLSSDLVSATRNELTLELTLQEQEALKLFFESENGFVDFQTLEEKVWDGKVVTSNSLRKLISSLRLKFEDKSSFKNIRGKGYQLNFEVENSSPNTIVEASHKEVDTPERKLKFMLLAAIFFVLVVLFSLIIDNPKSTPLAPISTQTVFQSEDYILDYAKHGNALYVTARNKNKSTLYKVVNRQNSVLMSADYANAFRALEIHSSGHTAMHVIEDAKCKIKIYKRPVEEQIDEIPCNRQNAFPSIDWIDENRFYITFNVSQGAPIRPYIYNLENKRLELATETNFDSLTGKRFIDAFIKGYDNGVLSLRENYVEKMSLMYFKGDQHKIIYEYRNKPYSFGVSEDALYFVSNKNELLKLDLKEDLLTQPIKPTVYLPPQAAKIDDPLILDNELYFSLGNTSKEVVYSIPEFFKYNLENGIRDLTYTDGILTVLGLTNTGYVVEQLKDNVVVNSLYFDTDISIRSVALYKGEIFLAGSHGIYKLVGTELIEISKRKTRKIISNGNCMLSEANGIYKYDEKINNFEMLVAQGERIFAGEQGCYFADNLSGHILNENREKIATQKMRKMLFEHKGRIAHYYHDGDSTKIVDLETDEVIAQTPSRILYLRAVSYKDDILYLGHSPVKTSIIKVNKN